MGERAIRDAVPAVVLLAVALLFGHGLWWATALPSAVAVALRNRWPRATLAICRYA